MMTTNKCACLAVAVFSVFIATGQDNKFKEVIPPSPNAASLGKYGDIPVSYHTGVPQISVPIHVVKEGELALPITLNYHSAGIKVEELASWVGLGWSLDAGGMITRSVVGAPDEGNNRSGGMSNGKFSGWYKDGGLLPGFLANECLSNPNTTQPGAIANSCLYYYMDAAKGVADTEPDIFSFNFAGYSGKFFFDRKQPVLQPMQDVKIIPSSDFSTWKIITPDGITYTFGGSGATEKSYFSGGALGGCCSPEQLSSTTWYLTKIENFNKNRFISLTYVPEKHSYAVRVAQSLSAESSGKIYINPSNPTNELQHAPYYANLISTSGVRLSRITTNSGNESVDFIANNLRIDVSSYQSESAANTEARRLDQIQVTTVGMVRQFDFDYSYFTSSQFSSIPFFGETLHDRFRLKLESVQERSGPISKPPHRFFYETSIPMARRLSLARDHWGYYNGVDTNTGLIPPFSIGTYSYNAGMANREPSEEKMKAWSLKKIVYPTGGYSEFVFEAHRQNDTQIVGGLRIKQVVSKDSDQSTPLVKNYSYDFGQLYAGEPSYVQNTSFHEYTTAILRIPTYIISSNSRNSLRSSQSYHIGYSTVWEEQPNNGKSTYRYINRTPSPEYYFPAAPVQFEIGVGELLEESHKDAGGRGVHTIRNIYKTEFGGMVAAKRVTSLSCLDCGTNCSEGGEFGGGLMYCNEFALVRNYSLQTGRRVLVARIEIKDGVSVVTNYSYSPNHNNPIGTSIFTSAGEEISETIDFAKDKFVSACEINDYNCYRSYQQTLSDLSEGLDSAIYKIIQEAGVHCETSSNWTNDDCATGSNFSIKNINMIEGWKSLLGIGASSFKKVYGNILGGCRNNCTIRKVGEQITAEDLVPQYTKHILDAQNQYLQCRTSVISEYTNCLENSMESLNQTDRRLAMMLTGNLNVALEKRAYVNSVQTGGERNIYDFQNNLLLPVEQYTYHPQSDWFRTATMNYAPDGNIQEVIKENDHSITYLWGYNNKLPIAKISNAKPSQVFYTSFEFETAHVSTDAKFGTKSYSIPFFVPVPSPGNYVLTYWQKINGGQWEYKEIHNVTETKIIGEINMLIDEVRLCPSDASITTYSYKPGVGITMVNDPNNVISYYEYDQSGRLILIKNDQGEIIKKFQYGYALNQD